MHQLSAPAFAYGINDSAEDTATGQTHALLLNPN